MGPNGLNLHGIYLKHKQFLNFSHANCNEANSMVISFLKNPPPPFILTLISWIFGGRGLFLCFYLCFSFYCWILCFKEEAYFLFPVFYAETLCPAFALHVTWEMAEHSRQQSCSFHLSFGEDENWDFGKQISGWLDIFQMG